VGGFIGQFIGWGGPTEFAFRSFALAVAGAMLLLLLYRLIFGRPQMT
jgi:uncharacterized membrane protein YeaQ/YmgE (transglycosylase-associated protein family)